MFSKRSHKENAELTERFSISENVRLIQDLPGVHRLVKLTVNEGFLAVWLESSMQSDLGKWFAIWSLDLAIRDFVFFKHPIVKMDH